LLESKKSYVRHISHELRTPLNTAFLGLKLLSSDLKASKNPQDTERYNTLRDVNMSCTAAVDILNDLLCYEKLESGILELHKENIAVDAFLRDCVTMFSAQARECGVTIVTVTDTIDNTEVPSMDGKVSSSLQADDVIYADKFKMNQVIRNLVSNALKFTPREGLVMIKATFVYDLPEETIRCADNDDLRTTSADHQNSGRRGGWSLGPFFRAKNQRFTASHSAKTCLTISNSNNDAIRGKLVIVVIDTGAGISKENQSRLFKEVVQFSPEKLQAGGGSGLGLWITQEIVNLHDGSISVSSEGEGKGSSFTIEMPMQRRHAAPPSVALHPSPSLSRVPLSLGSQSSLEADGDISDAADSIPRSTIPLELDLDVKGTVHHTVGKGNKGLPLDVFVVDDSRLNRKMLLKCLRADGHNCYEAEDGLEAVAMVKERIGYTSGSHGRPFDAILMDFVMPNMDGPTATKEIRALGYRAPIFGVTGNGEYST
jgi:two-component system, sensor histidine kinase